MSSDFGVDILLVPTKPIAGQRAGTSGLRKKVVEVQQPNFLENFVQSIFNALPENELKGSTIVLAGDGRYHNRTAINIIMRMAAASGIARIILAQGGLASTPAVSGIIREHQAYGGIILTASHNPGGPTEDFGIKYNCANGGPAPEILTELIYQKTLAITHYKIAKQLIPFSIDTIGEYSFGEMKISIIDSTISYRNLMKSLFDFDQLKQFLSRGDFRVLYDGMHGAGGPFAKEILINQLGASESSCINCQPSEDFAGGHPDPNLTYAHELVSLLGLGPHPATGELPDFGAASDGDADRNMILGKKFFVTPSDSVAIIAANSQYIPYFRSGLKGVARSMPTSAALDRVAAKLNIPCYEVPTGWKFFGNLMDAGRLSICGEESFGTGSDHIREKDGLWAVLAWLAILQGKNAHHSNGPLITVEEIVHSHWIEYGRNYYSRYDYEGIENEKANQLMNHLLQWIDRKEKNGEILQWDHYLVEKADEFTYQDPIDGSISSHQGIRFQFSDGSRIVYRLSGTGSVGATIRVYIEKYEADKEKINQETATALAPLIKIALEISRMRELTGREEPTVIT